MKKIKTVFVIDRENDDIATQEVTKGAEWVLEGKGVATLKIDGTPILKEDGVFFKRQARKLKKKFRFKKPDAYTEDMYNPANEGWIGLQSKPDPNTGHWPGWMPVDINSNEDKRILEAIGNHTGEMPDGTYELIGPTVQRNIYGLDRHMIVQHGSVTADVERTWECIKNFLESHYIEGIVFHNGDDMFKVRQKDFGFVWNPLADPRRHPDFQGEVGVASLSFENPKPTGDVTYQM